jgi:hypothetical protein
MCETRDDRGPIETTPSVVPEEQGEKLVEIMLTLLARVPDIEMRVAALDAQLRAEGGAEAVDALLETAFGGSPDARVVCVALAIFRARSIAPAALPAHVRVEPGLTARAMIPRFRGRRMITWTDFETGARYAERVSWNAHRREIANRVLPRMLLGIETWALERMLAEPALQLKTVVTLAAHRPSPAASMLVIARSSRWMSHAPIRAALASNPATPPAVVQPLLASLPRGSEALLSV